MPIKIPSKLPAKQQLEKEQVQLIASDTALRQDIRPMKVLLLNLMPKKRDTEVQFARLLGNSPLQIELTLMTTASYKPKNEETAYLDEFYYTLNDVKNNFYDALIVTGAPVETLPFLDVIYWDELIKTYGSENDEHHLNLGSKYPVMKLWIPKYQRPRRYSRRRI